ncbi:hypothetical protein LIER_39410 [Lithospermum erythrorhizon]|uniref:Uncharacterized protein n=1 Tax=Lithospermum erythrorhizon TaxID=34254 RepID=A0AAV3QFI2_LITER
MPQASNGGSLSAEPRSQKARRLGQDPGARKRIFPCRSATGKCLLPAPGGSEEMEGGKGGEIEYLTSLIISAENVFMEIEDKRMLPRPPKQKNPQTKWDMSKKC